MQKKKIAVLVGSLRKASYNKMMANQMIKMAPENLEMEIVEIGNLPLFNQDLEDNFPEAWTTFKQKISEADGYLFVTPEYNRSMSAAIKNALDVASRPYGQNAWAGKPGAVVSVSMSGIGGFGANHHLRQSMVFLDVYMMQQPEAYIGNAHEAFDESGEWKNEKTKEFAQKVVDGFSAWVNKF